MATNDKVGLRSLELAVELGKVALSQSSVGVGSPDAVATFIEIVAKKIDSLRRDA